MKQIKNWTLGGLLAGVLIAPASADFKKGWDAYLAGNHTAAMAEWAPLAEEGNVTAQYNMGVMYNTGRGMEKEDLHLAHTWYARAASQGDVMASKNRDVIEVVFIAKGVEAYNAGDYDTALAEFTALVEAGYAAAQREMGKMYAEGKGVEKNDAEALKWYRLAAEAGNAGAQRELGHMYKKDGGALFNKVAGWFGKDKPEPVLQKDDRLAYMWYDLAAAQGDKEAKKIRNKMAEDMKAKQLTEAQEMAKKCRAKNYKGC